MPSPFPPRSGHHHSPSHQRRVTMIIISFLIHNTDHQAVAVAPCRSSHLLAVSLCLTNTILRRVPVTLIHRGYPFVPFLFTFAILRSVASSCSLQLTAKTRLWPLLDHLLYPYFSILLLLDHHTQNHFGEQGETRSSSSTSQSSKDVCSVDAFQGLDKESVSSCSTPSSHTSSDSGTSGHL
ncbi:hypothetical protein PIB30_095884 [Stylosanthes scabra]|uniref:Uncharacterized protein n=1 Tax=Stylosanthes scabra TaxID=79078 RepID=A0ABU6RWP9_9FABA|nr:hypothetical protein [Stylosanthes scabra]